MWSNRAMVMIVIRTILTAVISISIAALPAIGEPIVSASAAKVVMADHADMPYFPCCNTQDNIKSTACVLKCILFRSRSPDDCYAALFG